MDKCIVCGMDFDMPSDKRKTCSDACRKQYQRSGESLQKSYNTIMSELNRMRRLIKTRPDLKPKIASSLAEIKAEAIFVGRMSGNEEMIALNEMKEQVSRKKF